MTVYLLVTAAVILYGIYLWRNRRPKNFPPGPPCLPVVGSTPFMSGFNGHFTMDKWRDQYGPVVGLMLGPLPAVAVVEARTVLEVLRHEDFQGRPQFDVIRDRTFGEALGLLFTDGPYWVEQRRFSLRHLRDFGFGKKSMEGLILEEAECLVKDLLRDSSKNIQVSMLFVVSVINVLWSLMAGVRHQRDDADFQSLLEKLNRIFREGNQGASVENTIPSLRYYFPKWKRTMQMQGDIQDFMRNTIREHEKTFDSNNMRDFIDVYLKEMQQGGEGSSFNEKSLIALCLDLFNAGSESSSNTLGFCVIYLLHHPDTRIRIQEELDRVVGRSRRVSLDDRPNLVYLEAFLYEVMRINPIAPLTVPHSATRDTTLKDNFIPKNTMLLVSLWSCFHDVTHWGDPQNFRPERHIDVDGKLIKDEYLVVFGVGKRACLGEALARNTLFLFFATMMQELEFTLPQGHELPSTISLPGFTVAPRPFEVLVKQRA